MPKPPPSQDDAVEMVKRLRGAIKQNELANVFRVAGATKITGQATEVLEETTAAQVASRLGQARQDGPSESMAPEAKATRAAKAAFDPGQLQEIFEDADIDPQKGHQAAAEEMTRIATSATAFAKAEGRPVCHNCSAIGAARAANQL